MEIAAALKSQYHAALKTLRLTIEQCPDELWEAPPVRGVVFWRVAYHTLFFTHFYLQKDEHSLTPWKHHREEANFMTSIPWEGNRPPKACTPYTRAEMLEYWDYVDSNVDGWVDGLDLAAPQCGFHWYPMGKLEHQIVNIRHIQNHAAALATRLRRDSEVQIAWVGKA